MSLFSRSAAAFTRPRVVVGGGVIGKLPLWQQYSRIGGNLTPSDVSSILRQADGGDCSRLVELANECRQKDGTLHSVLRTREMSLSALPFVVEPYTDEGADPTPRDSDVASFVKACISDLCGDGQDTVGFEELVAHLQSGIYHGFADAETRWQKRDGDIVPEAFAPIDARRFFFRNSDGRLVFVDGAIRSAYSSAGIDLPGTYPGQYIQHQPREMGDVPAREGLSRLLIWPALFRNWSVSDWMKLAELSWKPWRLGKLKKGAGQKDRDNLLEMLEYLTSAGVAVFNDEVAELDIHMPQQGSSGGSSRSNHAELCAFMAAEMAKGALGQTLTTEQGDRGSQSLGRVHDGVRRDIRAYDAQQMNGTLRRHLVAPVVWLNYGPSTKLPKTYFATDEATDLVSFGNGVKALKDAGLRIPACWVYDVAGIPEPGDDEDVLGEVDVDLKAIDAPSPADLPVTDAEPVADAEPAPAPPYAQRSAALLADLRELKELGLTADREALARKHGFDPKEAPWQT